MNEVSIELNSLYFNIGAEHQQSDETITLSTSCPEESRQIDPSSKTISTPSDKYIQSKSLALKSSMNCTKRFNITRRKIILFSIIALLITVIIVLIVIKFTVLDSHSTTNDNNTSKTSLYSSTTISTIYDVGQGGASSDPPCSSYTVVNDPLRNIATSGIGGSCDDGPLFNTSIGGRSIRFMGTGGTIIPLTSPGIYHCGAFLAGWFNGTLPSTIGTVVRANVCFDGPKIPCVFSSSVSVVNCSNFYVYFLPPLTTCNARYCTI
ncbi:unnamed protein product [Rotaria sp. Silwood2]|nr:unnamed protein product [Rotaria sp. Silwood2]CAF3970169.1 unnamed protein product [Rotaria sp. Silwood2]